MKQFFKIVNPKGHNGFKYKLGLNTDPDPCPLTSVGSCKPGALYFTDAAHLHHWLGYGTKLAWVKPVGGHIQDQDGDNKWKAKSLNVTRMEKLTLELLYDIPGLDPFGMLNRKRGFDPYFYMKKWNVKFPVNSTEVRDALVAEDEALIIFILSNKSDKQITKLLRHHDQHVNSGILRILAKLDKAHLIRLSKDNLRIINDLSPKNRDKIIKKLEKMHGLKKLFEVAISR